MCEKCKEYQYIQELFWESFLITLKTGNAFLEGITNTSKNDSESCFANFNVKLMEGTESLKSLKHLMYLKLWEK